MPRHRHLAVDVVLLLPEAVQARCRRMNEVLREDVPEGFAFDRTHVPHLTLVQCFVDRDDLAGLVRTIEGALLDEGSLRLRAAGLGRGGSTTHLVVERTVRIQRLHAKLVRVMEPFEVGGADSSAFYGRGDEPARRRDVRWVSRFRKDAAGANFMPHVTLGVGHTVPDPDPFTFTAERAALYQLGRHCTCRRLLADWTLRRVHT